MTKRAHTFVRANGHRLRGGTNDTTWKQLHDQDVPDATIEQMAAYDEHWGGLLLPPAHRYNGGPKILRSGNPQPAGGDGWWFDAGDQRYSMDYAFCFGPHGEFGIEDGGQNRAVLHNSVAGWVEALALEHAAAKWATHLTQVRGSASDGVDLSGFEPFPEIAGVSDNWWRNNETVIAVYRGESLYRAKTRHSCCDLGFWRIDTGDLVISVDHAPMYPSIVLSSRSATWYSR